MADVTAGVKGAAQIFGQRAQNLGTNVANAFRATGETLQGGGGWAGRALMKPVEWAVKVASWPVAVASGFYKLTPVLATVATVGAGALAVRSFVRNRAEARTQEQLMEQAQMPMTNPYMNSVTPQEAAMLNARLKENSQGAGFGDQVVASRAAAQPENASAL